MDARLRAWALRSAGANEILARRRLDGGIVGTVEVLSLRRNDGSVRPLVFKCWPELAAADERQPSVEVTSLAFLAGSGLPVPGLVAADPHGEQAGLPCMLTTLLPGEPDLAPTDLDRWLPALATLQAAVHATAPTPGLPAACQWWPADRRRPWLGADELRAVELARDATGTGVFVHGDFQHFNVLWAGGAVSGLVDWGAAGLGNRSHDVGHCRLNLAVLFGPDAADGYLDAYERAAGVRVDPAGDLRGLLGWDEGWPRFIPRQLADRAGLPPGPMADRVAETVRRVLARLP